MRTKDVLVNREGFWASREEPDLPTPVNTSWKNRTTFLRTLLRVESMAWVDVVGYKGFSMCRMCDTQNGSEEYTFSSKGNTWVWPSGYLHYLRDHQVRPSLAFEEFINQVGKPT